MRRESTTYQLVPLNWHTSAVDVSRVPVLEILQAGVARFLFLVSGRKRCKVGDTDLSVACLEAKMEESTNAVLCGSWGVVQDKAEAVIAVSVA